MAFSELLFHISHNKDYRHIKNIYSKFNNKVFKNEVRPLIANLDELPYPNWDMWDDRHISNVREYFDFESKKLVKKRTGQFETSRGCPYSCSYCINNALKRIYKNKGIYHRTKSVHRIINELIFYVNRYKLEHINLIDDTFLMDLDWLREFAKEYRMKVNLPFAFYTRPELVNKETMRCVVEAGANMIRIGIECGDEDYRKNILLRNYTNNQIINAFKTAKMFGINTYSFNIIGLPSIDTALLIKKTININRIVKPDHIQVTTFFPFPGTDLFKYSLRKKYFKYQNIFSKKSFYDETVLKLPRISARHLFRLSKLFNAYVATDYLSFRYIYYKTLENSDLLYRTFIERTNGLYNFLKPVILIMKKFIKFIEKDVRRKTVH